MGIEMKIIFLQNLTGGLFGGILKGLLKSRLNGLFARTPTVAVLLLTAVIAACASGDPKSNNLITPTTTTTPSTPADCTFAEDTGGSTDCGLIDLTRSDSSTTYNITVGEVDEETTDKIRLSNFTFTPIVNGNPSDEVEPDDDNQLILSANATALNVTIRGIADNVFGNFYLDLVLVNNAGAAIAAKFRYTISITPVNDAPVFEALRGSESQFTAANDARNASYGFDGIPLNSTAGYSVGNVSITDIDNDTITYSIIGGDDVTNLFQISAATGESATGSARGEITLKAIADTAGPYTFNVNATDGNGGSAIAVITVEVLPVTDTTPPVFTETSYSFNLNLSDENAAGDVVGNVLATDVTLFDYSLSVDIGTNLFELAAADNADGSINIILHRDATPNDFRESSIIFRVEATHREDEMISSVAEVTFNFINDLPFEDDSDGDGVNDFYDAYPDDSTRQVNGNGEPNNPYNITSIYQLQAIAGVDHEGTALGSSGFTNNSFLYGTDAADQLTKHYKLVNDIDASDTAVWAKPAVTTYVGYGWTPIAGNSSQSFSGSFNGEGYAINSLEILARQGDNSKHFGLFGINNGSITAVGLQDAEIEIEAPTGTYTKSTTIDTIISGSHAGGLVGLNQEDGIISYSYTTGDVNASMDAIGGLVGLNQGEISYSYSTATVLGEGDTGGLVGTNQEGAILSSYATGDVEGSDGIEDRTGTAGGLAGSISGAGAIINTSYAAGDVSDKEDDAEASLGGVVGERNQTTGNGVTIESSYWDRSSSGTGLSNGVGKNRDDTSVTVDETGTIGISQTHLFECGLDGVRIGTTGADPACPLELFPSSNWGITTDGDIERGWIFIIDQPPSLSAVHSTDGQLLPSAAEQQCHRTGNPLGICE